MCKRLPALIVLLLVAATGQGYALTEVTPSVVPAGMTLQQYGHALAEPPSPDYSNTTTYTGYYYPAGADWMAADDVHRTTNLPIARIDFAYGSMVTSGTTDALLGIYANNAEDSVIEWIAGYPITGLPVNGLWAVEFNLPEPLIAPADLWIGLRFDLDQTGFLIYDPPTVGTSHDLIWDEEVGLMWFGGDPVANLHLATYPVPEPTGLLVLSSGIIGVVALRRRR